MFHNNEKMQKNGALKIKYNLKKTVSIVLTKESSRWSK